MKNFKWCIWSAVLLFSLVSFPAFTLDNRFEVPIGDSPFMGPENAPVTIIEFLDYQ